MGDEGMTIKWKIPLNKPFFRNTQWELVKLVIESGMVSQGEMVKRFEDAIKEYTGARHAVAVSSCTAGIYIALRSIVDLWNCQAIVPAFTFPAIHRCVEHFGGEMGHINADVDLSTFNINTTEIHKTVKNAGKALEWIETIMPVHQFGMPCDISDILDIACENGINVIEDAACALGSTYNGKKIGSEGTAVFSFHGRKVLTTGEGGMIVTDNKGLYEKCVQMRQFGRNNEGEFVGHGLNFKMSDVAAAIGLAQLQNLDDAINKRHRIAALYNDAIRHYAALSSSIVLPYEECDSRGTNWQSYVIRLLKPTGSVMRDTVIERIRSRGIEAQIGSYDNSGGTCTNSAELAKTTIALPIFPEMRDSEVLEVVYALSEAMK